MKLFTQVSELGPLVLTSFTILCIYVFKCKIKNITPSEHHLQFLMSDVFTFENTIAGVQLVKFNNLTCQTDIFSAYFAFFFYF